MTPSVLLAADGSDHAHRAAGRAIDMASDRSATLHVLCVVDKRVMAEPGLSAAEASTIGAEDRAHDCIETVTRMAEGTGVEVSGDVRHGVPHELIREYATEIDAEAVVIGEHGDHAEHLGGVGRRLIAESDLEVVVVGD